tara:strand:- start:628 stop:765 length:138 start_codon:yes stop_codon:yes gene_type:complete
MSLKKKPNRKRTINGAMSFSVQLIGFSALKKPFKNAFSFFISYFF